MSDALKIMVRTNARRALTREEAYAREAAITQHRVSEDAHNFLIGLGYIASSYLSAVKASQWGQYGSAEFHTLRASTLAEEDAWHSQQSGRHFTQCDSCPTALLIKNLDHKLLDGLEIILEVVKGDTVD